jgi:hypothetical protein
MRHSPLRHLITATLAIAFMAAGVACSSASPQALDRPEITATPDAPVPSTAPPSKAAPITSTRRPTSRPTIKHVDPCVPIGPGDGFYEGGRIASAELRTPNTPCTTISVSNVRDPANPTDVCQTFLVGFWPPVNLELTYTKPVTACGGHRTVLARNVPNHARYIVLYDIDDLGQDGEFRIWH